MRNENYSFNPSLDVLYLLGKNILAAGYAVYGVSTLLVLASAGGAAVYQVIFFFKIITEICPPTPYIFDC
jgi:fructose-1,6-bisphosphatase